MGVVGVVGRGEREGADVVEDEEKVDDERDQTTPDEGLDWRGMVIR